VACLLLNIVQGFTSAEIAQILNFSPEAAKKRLARAKQRLRAAYFAQEVKLQGRRRP
jgi:DNA-directed RNA polymerase specialized sigma24 family protein